MTDNQVIPARIFSISELKHQIARAKDRAEAKTVADQAQANIEDRIKKADREAVRRRSLMQSAAKLEITKEMDDTRRKATAIAVHEVLESAAKVHRKFDALTPWIEDLVETSLRRIIGTIPEPTLLKSIVTQAISQNRSELKYILRAGTEAYEPAQNIVSDLENTEFGGLILDVEIARDLDPEAIILTSSDGALDISLETQVTAVRNELEAVLRQANDAN